MKSYLLQGIFLQSGSMQMTGDHVRARGPSRIQFEAMSSRGRGHRLDYCYTRNFARIFVSFPQLFPNKVVQFFHHTRARASNAFKDVVWYCHGQRASGRRRIPKSAKSYRLSSRHPSRAADARHNTVCVVERSWPSALRSAVIPSSSIRRASLLRRQLRSAASSPGDSSTQHCLRCRRRAGAGAGATRSPSIRMSGSKVCFLTRPLFSGY